MSAACVLVCDECYIYQAAKDSRRVGSVAVWFRRERGVEVAPEEIRCEGCKGDRQRHWLPGCWIVGCCVDERGLESCSACCSHFPAGGLRNGRPIARDTVWPWRG